MIEKDFVLDSWHVEVDRGRITRAKQTVRLEPQIMKVLVFLAEHHNEVVSKERLMEALWKNAYIGDAALTRCICEIRQAFGDNPKAPRIVETIPKVGYRLIARLAPLQKSEKMKRPKILWSAAAGIVIAALLFWSYYEQQPAPFSENAMADSAYKQGVTHFERYEYNHNENAVALFEKAAEYDPEFGLAYASLAAALVHQVFYYGGDRRVDARAAANKALDLEPESAASHNADGLVFSMFGDEDRALQSFERAYTLEPGHWQSTFNAATILRRNTEYKKAEALFLRTLVNSPDHVVAMEHLGFLYLRMGDVETANYWLSRAKNMAPVTIYASAQTAVLALLEGNMSDATENCELVFSYAPKHVQCLYVMGVSNLLAGNMTEARKWFDHAIVQLPESHYAKLGKAQVFLADGNADEGMEIIDQIIEEALASVDQADEGWGDHWILAAAYALQGNEVQAYNWLEKAAERGRRFYLWDSKDPVFANLHGDKRFDRYIAMTMVSDR